jgi:hypothetical protein
MPVDRCIEFSPVDQRARNDRLSQEIMLRLEIIGAKFINRKTTVPSRKADDLDRLFLTQIKSR